MPKNPKKSEDVRQSKDGKNLSEEEYKAKVAEWYGIALDDLGFNPASGQVWYRAKYEPGSHQQLNQWPMRLPEGGYFWDGATYYNSTSHKLEAKYLFKPEFVWKPKKYGKMIGVPLGDLADLTAIGRTWRKPGYRKLRHVYVKNGVIAALDVATHRHAKSLGPIGCTREGVKHIKDRIVEVGARQVFMIHNCPSADYTPPSIDGDLIAISKAIPELKAHIVIYPDSLDLISLKTKIIMRVVPNLPSRPPGVWESHRRVSRSSASPQLAAWAYALTGERDFFVGSLAEKGPIRPL